MALNTAEIPDYCEVVVAPIALHIPYVVANLTSGWCDSTPKCNHMLGKQVAPKPLDSHLTLLRRPHTFVGVVVSAQNCGANAKTGAFTGELCASQLVDFGT